MSNKYNISSTIPVAYPFFCQIFQLFKHTINQIFKKAIHMINFYTDTIRIHQKSNYLYSFNLWLCVLNTVLYSRTNIWKRILKTIKQRNNNFNFLLKNFIWTNRRGETELYFLPIGRTKIADQENKNILDEIVALCFNCF